jgi:hypothetical protein
VLERAERELRDIRDLLKVPTPDNLLSVNQKLEYLVSFLRSLTEKLPAESCDANTRAFVHRLPGEMSGIRALMQAPANLLNTLHVRRAGNLCAYERSGTFKALRLSSRTLGHL